MLGTTEPVCFNSLVLAQTWWAYAAAVALWIAAVIIYLLLEARWQIKGNFWCPWRWELTPRQWKLVAVVALIAAVCCSGVTYGLLYLRLTHRRNTYVGALADWARHTSTAEEPENECLARLVESTRADRAKAFVDIGLAICQGFPELSKRDRLSKEEITNFAPALSYWFGKEPTDVVVQGHRGNNWLTSNCLPAVGVPRQDWPGGDTPLKWSSKKLSFLGHLIELSNIVRGTGHGRVSVPRSKVRHPVELRADEFVDLRDAMKNAGAAIAKEVGAEPASIKLSGCARFWYIYSRIVERYRAKGATSAGEREPWNRVQRYVAPKAVVDWEGNGWLYLLMQIQITELELKEAWLPIPDLAKKNGLQVDTGFSPGAREKYPLLPDPDDIRTRPSVELSREMANAYGKLYSAADAWKSGPCSARQLAAVFFAEHVYIAYVDPLLKDVTVPTAEQRKVIEELRRFPEKGLWNSLFNNHGRIVDGLE